MIETHFWDKRAVPFATGHDYTGTEGDDVRDGTAHDDTFNFGQGGNDTLSGKNGNDTFNMGATFTPFDTIDGGKGDDTLVLNGDYLSGGQMNFHPDTIHSIETIRLTAGFDYLIVTHDDNVARNATLTIDGSHLGPDDTLLMTGNLDGDSLFVLKGGAGDDGLTGSEREDRIFGGAGDDRLSGNGGIDLITGGAGKDAFTIGSTGESTGVKHDAVTDFDAEDDVFNVTPVITGVDHKVVGGALETSGFNQLLEAAIGKHELDAQHAVVFVPDEGQLAGHLILVIDANGKAGYQGNHDIVVDITGAAHLAQLSAANFISDIG